MIQFIVMDTCLSHIKNKGKQVKKLSLDMKISIQPLKEYAVKRQNMVPDIQVPYNQKRENNEVSSDMKNLILSRVQTYLPTSIYDEILL